MTELNEQDIDVLMNALDALASKPSSDGLMISMLSIGLSRGEDREKIKADMDKTMADARAESEKMKETIILVKAKLIHIRDEQTANEMAKVLITGK